MVMVYPPENCSGLNISKGNTKYCKALRAVGSVTKRRAAMLTGGPSLVNKSKTVSTFFFAASNVC